MAKKTLWDRFASITPYQFDKQGYVGPYEKNLLPGVRPEQFAPDLETGSGNELHNKFRAIHSSSALAVNSFAPFKDQPQKLTLCGKTNFTAIHFERQCPTGLGGTPPNLDLLVENDSAVIGVESKFLETLSHKKPKFSPSYCREKLPQAEDIWLELLNELRAAGPGFLDTAQLVKHYLGLRNQKEFQNKKITLLYLFWEPGNWEEFTTYVEHRKEIERFTERVKNSDIEFTSQSYNNLWDEWKKENLLTDHVINLHQRYSLAI